eukprot:scaffold6.g2876.t1
MADDRITLPAGLLRHAKRRRLCDGGQSLYHGGSRHTYMVYKEAKQQEQFAAASAALGAARSRLFEGVSIYVDGRTTPSHADLKQLMFLHGGKFQIYLSRSTVTHVIASNLPDTKIKEYAKARNAPPVVRPEWVVESIRAGRPLPIADFLLSRLRDVPGQRRLQGFRPLPQGEAARLPDAALYGEQAGLVGAALAGGTAQQAQQQAQQGEEQQEEHGEQWGEQQVQRGLEHGLEVVEEEWQEVPGDDHWWAAHEDEPPWEVEDSQLPARQEGQGEDELRQQQLQQQAPDPPWAQREQLPDPPWAHEYEEESGGEEESGRERDPFEPSLLRLQQAREGQHQSPAPAPLPPPSPAPAPVSQVLRAQRAEQREEEERRQARERQREEERRQAEILARYPYPHEVLYGRSRAHQPPPWDPQAQQRDGAGAGRLPAGAAGAQPGAAPRPPPLVAGAGAGRGGPPPPAQQQQQQLRVRPLNPSVYIPPSVLAEQERKQQVQQWQQRQQQQQGQRAQRGRGPGLGRHAQSGLQSLEALLGREPAGSPSAATGPPPAQQQGQWGQQQQQQQQGLRPFELLPQQLQRSARRAEPGRYDEREMEEAQRLAARLRSECAVLKGPVHSFRDDPEHFVETFFKSSRLHFIGSWKERVEALLVATPPSAPRPAAPGPGHPRTVVHLDMDCFFASVTEAAHPILKGKPLAVSHSASAHGTGEVSTCNYEARKFGVRSGISIGAARERCPHLIVVPYDYEAYNAVCEKVYGVLLRYTSCVQPLSVDEAYLDITGLGDPGALVAAMRADIAAATGCTASAGVGPNLLVARIATERAKPDGQHIVAAFLADLPAGELPGVGPSHRDTLAQAGLATVRDVQASTRGLLQRLLGPKLGAQVHDYALGRDSRPVEGGSKARKSVAAEITWGVRFDHEAHAAKFMDCLGAGEPAKFLGCGACDALSKSVTLAGSIAGARELAREGMALLRGLRVPWTNIRGVGLQARGGECGAVTKLEREGDGELARLDEAEGHQQRQGPFAAFYQRQQQQAQPAHLQPAPQQQQQQVQGQLQGPQQDQQQRRGGAVFASPEDRRMPQYAVPRAPPALNQSARNLKQSFELVASPASAGRGGWQPSPPFGSAAFPSLPAGQLPPASPASPRPTAAQCPSPRSPRFHRTPTWRSPAATPRSKQHSLEEVICRHVIAEADAAAEAAAAAAAQAEAAADAAAWAPDDVPWSDDDSGVGGDAAGGAGAALAGTSPSPAPQEQLEQRIRLAQWGQPEREQQQQECPPRETPRHVEDEEGHGSGGAGATAAQERLLRQYAGLTLTQMDAATLAALPYAVQMDLVARLPRSRADLKRGAVPGPQERLAAKRSRLAAPGRTGTRAGSPLLPPPGKDSPSQQTQEPPSQPLSPSQQPPYQEQDDHAPSAVVGLQWWRASQRQWLRAKAPAHASGGGAGAAARRPPPRRQQPAGEGGGPAGLPPLSQLDPSVLRDLPLGLRREIETAYGIKPHLRPSRPAAPARAPAAKHGGGGGRGRGGRRPPPRRLQLDRRQAKMDAFVYIDGLAPKERGWGRRGLHYLEVHRVTRMSQVDQGVMEQLPGKLRRQIERQLQPLGPKKKVKDRVGPSVLEAARLKRRYWKEDALLRDLPRCLTPEPEESQPAPGSAAEEQAAVEDERRAATQPDVPLEQLPRAVQAFRCLLGGQEQALGAARQLARGLGECLRALEVCGVVEGAAETEEAPCGRRDHAWGLPLPCSSSDAWAPWACARDAGHTPWCSPQPPSVASGDSSEGGSAGGEAGSQGHDMRLVDAGRTPFRRPVFSPSHSAVHGSSASGADAQPSAAAAGEVSSPAAGAWEPQQQAPALAARRQLEEEQEQGAGACAMELDLPPTQPEAVSPGEALPSTQPMASSSSLEHLPLTQPEPASAAAGSADHPPPTVLVKPPWQLEGGGASPALPSTQPAATGSPQGTPAAPAAASAQAGAAVGEAALPPTVRARPPTPAEEEDGSEWDRLPTQTGPAQRLSPVPAAVGGAGAPGEPRSEGRPIESGRQGTGRRGAEPTQSQQQQSEEQQAPEERQPESYSQLPQPERDALLAACLQALGRALHRAALPLVAGGLEQLRQLLLALRRAAGRHAWFAAAAAEVETRLQGRVARRYGWRLTLAHALED